MITLIVIPSDSIDSLLNAGYNKDFLRDYFNPRKMFDRVYLLSPIEKKIRRQIGLTIISTPVNELKFRIREIQADIIRAYGGYWACDLACKNKVNHVPVVVSVHDTNPALLYDSISNADIVFCMSKVVRNLVLKKFKYADRVWILPNRVNFDIMRPQNEILFQNLNQKYPFQYKILHIGRKDKQKNLDNTIKMLNILGKSYCLLAIGKGDITPYIDIAKKEGVADRCFFIDSIPNEQLPLYYSWADCFCTPSRWEGFGIVFIEALACEAIVVTSGIAPMNEYIEHLKNGLLVKNYEDPEALAKMVRIACTDQEVRQTLKRNARKSVEYFEKSNVDALEAKYYQKILLMKQAGKFQISIQKRLKSIFLFIVKKNQEIIDHVYRLDFFQKLLPVFPDGNRVKVFWNHIKERF